MPERTGSMKFAYARSAVPYFERSTMFSWSCFCGDLLPWAKMVVLWASAYGVEVELRPMFGG